MRGTFDHVEAVHDWLVHRDECTGSVGFAWLLAWAVVSPSCSLSVAVSWLVQRQLRIGPEGFYEESSLAGGCPIVASFGARDRTLRGAADRLAKALGAAGVAHDVKEYPDAGHGFLNDHEGANHPLPALFRLMGRFMRYGDHETSAGYPLGDGSCRSSTCT